MNVELRAMQEANASVPCEIEKNSFQHEQSYCCYLRAARRWWQASSCRDPRVNQTCLKQSTHFLPTWRPCTASWAEHKSTNIDLVKERILRSSCSLAQQNCWVLDTMNKHWSTLLCFCCVSVERATSAQSACCKMSCSVCVCVCVCVCVSERERERESSVCVCVCVSEREREREWECVFPISSGFGQTRWCWLEEGFSLFKGVPCGGFDWPGVWLKMVGCSSLLFWWWAFHQHVQVWVLRVSHWCLLFVTSGAYCATTPSVSGHQLSTEFYSLGEGGVVRFACDGDGAWRLPSSLYSYMFAEICRLPNIRNFRRFWRDTLVSVRTSCWDVRETRESGSRIFMQVGSSQWSLFWHMWWENIKQNSFIVSSIMSCSLILTWWSIWQRPILCRLSAGNPVTVSALHATLRLLNAFLSGIFLCATCNRHNLFFSYVEKIWTHHSPKMFGEWFVATHFKVTILANKIVHQTSKCLVVPSAVKKQIQ